MSKNCGKIATLELIARNVVNFNIPQLILHIRDMKLLYFEFYAIIIKVFFSLIIIIGAH